MPRKSLALFVFAVGILLTGGDALCGRAPMTAPDTTMASRTAPDDLLALVYRYYPRWDPTEMSLDDFADRHQQTPEWRALAATLPKAAEQRAEAWREFLARVSQALPDHRVGDYTWRYGDACNTAVLDVAPPEPDRFRVIVVAMSLLAPLYLVYEAHGAREDGRWAPSTLYYEPKATHLLEIVDREMTALGFQRLDPDLALLQIPDIAPGNLLPGEATLADALFTDNRW